MDVVLIYNGLGNQMSQYAFYLRKKSESNSTRFLFNKKSKTVHNGYELGSVFGIQYQDTFANKILYMIYKIIEYKKFPFISKPIIRILNALGIQVINEDDDYNFKPEYLRPSRGIKFYVGGWHSEKYFVDIKEKVSDAFTFKSENIGKENIEMYQRIKSCNSVSVHVRRGDFLDANNYHKFGAVCTLNYFVQAIERIKSDVENPRFFFFTNDHSWVRDNFAGDGVEVVDINILGNSWKDMFLISSCLHNIDSNGSFSWWSSWLNKNENKMVIVPKNFMVGRYFKDIYPPGWIQLSAY